MAWIHCGAELLMRGGSPTNAGTFSRKSTTPFIVAGQDTSARVFGNRTNESVVPVNVDSRTWASVACGAYHTIAVKKDGTLWGWGANSNGQLGDGTTTQRTSPVQIGSDTNWASVACGNSHTIAVKTTDSLWGWGSNLNGQLGFGEGFSSTLTTNGNARWLQAMTEEFLQISLGSSHVIGIKKDGTLWGWGYNSTGQLGDGTTTTRNSPVQIGSDTNWASVACGSGHTIAVKTTGTLWGWGYNVYGQLGDGTTTTRNSPVQIGSDTNWASVACGSEYTIARKTTGTLWGWGYNVYGQLGDGTYANRNSPVQIGSDTNWASVACGGSHTIAVQNDGTLWGWGSNGGGQFGINTNTERGGRPEQENARSVLSPFLVDLDGNSDQPFLVENWLSVIPHKVFNYDYDYYYTYTYDYVNGNYYRVKPTTSSTIALATVKPNQKS